MSNAVIALLIILVVAPLLACSAIWLIWAAADRGWGMVPTLVLVYLLVVGGALAFSLAVT